MQPALALMLAPLHRPQGAGGEPKTMAHSESSAPDGVHPCRFNSAKPAERRLGRNAPGCSATKAKAALVNNNGIYKHGRQKKCDGLSTGRIEDNGIIREKGAGRRRCSAAGQTDEAIGTSKNKRNKRNTRKPMDTGDPRNGQAVDILRSAATGRALTQRQGRLQIVADSAPWPRARGSARHC
jgi:hypothetical protein